MQSLRLLQKSLGTLFQTIKVVDMDHNPNDYWNHGYFLLKMYQIGIQFGQIFLHLCLFCHEYIF